MDDPTDLKLLAKHLNEAQWHLLMAASMCPGNPALQVGLLERATWCHEQHLNTLERLSHGGLRRAGDQPRREG